MTTKAGLKAGGIGAAVGLLLGLLGLTSLVPQIAVYVSCICLVVTLLAYVIMGVVGGYFVAPPRTAGAGAGAGAIAGALTSLVYGIVSTLSSIIYSVATGGAGTAMTPDTLEALRQAGISPDIFSFLTSTGGGALCSALCCLGTILVGAALGAIGGAIMAAAKKE